MFNKFKFALFTAICTVMLLGLSSNSSYSQYAGCMPCEWPATDTPVQKWGIELPQFPGCSLYVTYHVLTCPGSNIRYYVGLSWGLDGGDCSDLIDHFVKKNPDGSIWIDWFAFNEILTWVYEEVALEDFEAQNPALYQCPMSYYTTKFVKSYCSAFRIVLYHLSTYGYGIRCWEQQPCAISGCCFYNNQYCWDNGVVKVTYSDTFTGTCPPQPKPSFLCTPQVGDMVFETDCFTWCQARQ